MSPFPWDKCLGPEVPFSMDIAKTIQARITLLGQAPLFCGISVWEKKKKNNENANTSGIPVLNQKKVPF